MKVSSINFHENLSSGIGVDKHRRTDRHDVDKRRFSRLCEQSENVQTDSFHQIYRMIQTSKLFVESTIKCQCKLSGCSKLSLWGGNVGSYRTACNLTRVYVETFRRLHESPCMGVCVFICVCWHL